MPVNKQNIDILIDILKDEEVFFDMADYQIYTSPSSCGTASCGTASCLCGHINYILNGGKMEPQDWGRHSTANKFLGISDSEGRLLFLPEEKVMPDIYGGDLSLQRKLAINTLLHLKETGEVNWSDANQKIGA